MNEKAEFAVEMLKQYAFESGFDPRNTSDLSPLEEWLLVTMFYMNKTTKSYNHVCPKCASSDVVFTCYCNNCKECN